MQSEKEIWFRTICLKNGITLTDFQIELMSQYVKLLLEWNKKINLISRKDEDNVWTYHILHSVSPLFKVSIIGVGMVSHSGVAAKMFKTMANESINIMMISTSEIKISCIIQRKYTELAVTALHDAFGLEKKK